MYILVNNNPINVFTVYISEIVQFEPSITESLIHNYYAESQYSNPTYYRLYTRALSSKALIANKIELSEYQKYSADGYDYYDCIRNNKNPGFIVWEDFRGSSRKYFKIDYDKDNFYFYIDDAAHSRTVFSAPYPTKEKQKKHATNYCKLSIK